MAEHPRSFGRGDTLYDPWHYVPVLARKPGALRNGAPFKDWVLPAAMERVRRKLSSAGVRTAEEKHGLDLVSQRLHEILRSALNVPLSQGSKQSCAA